MQMDHQIPFRRPDFVVIKKKRICHLVDFADPADHRVKIKENEQLDTQLGFARDLKKKSFGAWMWLGY